METAANALKSVLPVALGGEPAPTPTVAAASTSTATDPAARTDIKTEEEKKRDADNLTKEAQPGSFASGGDEMKKDTEDTTGATSGLSSYLPNAPTSLTGNGTTTEGKGLVASAKEGAQNLVSGATSSLPSISSTTKEGPTTHEGQTPQAQSDMPSAQGVANTVSSALPSSITPASMKDTSGTNTQIQDSAAYPTREQTFPADDEKSEGYLAKATSALPSVPYLSSDKETKPSQSNNEGRGIVSNVASSLPSVPSLTTASGQDQDRSTGTGIAEKISSSLPASIAPTSTETHSHSHSHESHPHPHKHQHKHHEHIVAPSFVSKTGGVGSLPGTPNEAGVAVLPDEKVEIQREGLGDLPAGEGIGKVEQIGELGPVAGGAQTSRREEVGNGFNSNQTQQPVAQTQARPTFLPSATEKKTPGAYDPTSVSGEGPHGLVWDDKTGAFVHRRDLEGAGTGL